MTDFNGVNHDDLHLVRVQRGLEGMRIDPQDGALVLGRSASGRAADMNTFHYTLNAVVANHAMGTHFDASCYVIVAPLGTTCHEGGNVPSGMMPADTYFHADAQGEMTLPDAVLLAPAGAAVPQDLAQLVETYPAGDTPEQTMANRNAAVRGVLARRGAPMFEVDHDNWIGKPMPGLQDINDFRDAFAQGCEMSCGRHESAAEGTWEKLVGLYESKADMYLKGQRMYEDEWETNGRTDSVYAILTARKEQMNAFLDERKANHADPKAMAFYQRTLDALAQTYDDRLAQMRHAELKDRLYDHYYTAHEGQMQGPFAKDDFVGMVRGGQVRDDTLVWRAEMTAWTTMGRLPERASLAELAAHVEKPPAMVSSFMRPPEKTDTPQEKTMRVTVAPA